MRSKCKRLLCEVFTEFDINPNQWRSSLRLKSSSQPLKWSQISSNWILDRCLNHIFHIHFNIFETNIWSVKQFMSFCSKCFIRFDGKIETKKSFHTLTAINIIFLMSKYFALILMVFPINCLTISVAIIHLKTFSTLLQFIWSFNTIIAMFSFQIIDNYVNQ